MTLKESNNLKLAQHDRLAELGEHWPPKALMGSVVSSIPTGATLFSAETF